MRSDLIVVLLPVFDQYLSLKERGEDLHVEKFVPSLPVERFNVPILPRTPGLNVQGLDPKIP